eukprot:PhF_6_TR22849/c0_g1_i1/m.32472
MNISVQHRWNTLDYAKRTPLLIAASLGHGKAAELLISLGAKASSAALGLSTKSGHLDVIKVLLDSSHGFLDINEKDKRGVTALYRAAVSYRNTDSAKILTSCGANLNEKFERGRTYLHAAATNNCESLARLLLDLGADVDEMDAEGSSSLLEACKHGND